MCHKNEELVRLNSSALRLLESGAISDGMLQPQYETDRDREWSEFVRFLSDDRQSSLAMIICYMDESGTHEASKAVAVGGYVARWEQWIKFRRRWNLLLKKYGVSDFHMKDIAHFKREFEGWKEDRRNSFLEGAAAIIRRHTILAFGVGFITADYEANERADKYLVCLHGAIQLLLFGTVNYRRFLNLRTGERISFVFDQKPGFEGGAEKVFAYLREKVESADRLLGNITFAQRKDCEPLQAADFFAYEITKALADRRYSARPPRRSLLALLEGYRLVFHEIDAAGLRNMSKLLT
jgi:hypothetical protein